MNNKDQQHPQEKRDGDIINQLLQQEATPKNLAELARLRIRYDNFPGARVIQRDLDMILQQWQLTEEELFAKTRELHATGQIYSRSTSGGEDWS